MLFARCQQRTDDTHADGRLMVSTEQVVLSTQCDWSDGIFSVSIRRTTGFEPFYTPIATVTINLIVAVAIVLLNLYVAVGISFQILQPVWSTHFPDVATSIDVEADSIVPHV